jgi:hypothetical protein
VWTPIATGDSPQLGQLQAACAPGAPIETAADHAAAGGGPDLDSMRAAAFEKQVSRCRCRRLQAAALEKGCPKTLVRTKLH